MSNSQIQGPIGFLVDRMIRNSVRKGFHTVWWIPPSSATTKTIFVANHHGWFDGYLMYLAACRLQVPVVEWVEEYASFPLFGYAGGLPFPKNDLAARASTIRQTVRRMNQGEISIALFAEGILHRPPGLLKFERAFDLLCQKVEGATVIPVAIRYEMSIHERPESFLLFGDPTPARESSAELAQAQVSDMLEKSWDQELRFERLYGGTPDVNERWDMRKIPFLKR